MTVEELKLEAAKLGYKLIKKQESIKFLPCICGRNARHLWWDCDTQMCFYRCKYCGFKGNQGKTERKAKINWNKTIEASERKEV